ncbi:hypothetical protein [Asticcacaulis sp.]|uniref:hypothetical protein n=1 Tax=Asticcacaulis sp. TaxID=1872648 RepID=UPI00391ACEAC
MALIGLIFDDVSIPYLVSGALPRTSMSHDFNLFQFGHHALSEGHDVVFLSTSSYYNGETLGSIKGIYPNLEIYTESFRTDDVKPDILLSNHIQVFAWGQAPYAKKVAIHPALYFVEMPVYYTDHQTRAQLLAARYHVDFIFVQNERMRDILVAFYGWLAGWSEANRIIINPLGLIKEEKFSPIDRNSARSKLGLEDTDVCIVNAGGIWRWTGFNDYLRAFVQAVRGGASNLVLVMTGFRQAENEDHGDYIAETRQILRENADIVGDRTAAGQKRAKIRIHVEEDWIEASKKLPLFLSAADFGLNVNGDGLENWQAQRVRCLDYTRYSLPLLTTRGDNFSDNVAGEGAVRLSSNSPAEVTETLMQLSRSRKVTESAKNAAKKTKTRLESPKIMQNNLRLVLNTPKRIVSRDKESMLEAFWRIESRIIRDRAVQEMAQEFGL